MVQLVGRQPITVIGDPGEFTGFATRADLSRVEDELELRPPIEILPTGATVPPDLPDGTLVVFVDPRA